MTAGTAVALRAIEAGAGPGARDQVDDAVRSDLANAAVAGDYVEAALGVEREGAGTEEGGLQGGPAVARISGLAGSREGADGAIGSDLTDAIAAGVAHIEVPGGIEDGSSHAVEGRVDGGASVAAGKWTGGGVAEGAAGLAQGNGLPVSGHGGDDAFGRDSAHAGVAEIGDVKRAGFVEGELCGVAELRAGGGCAVTGKCAGQEGRRLENVSDAGAGAGDGGDGSIEGDFPHAVVARIGDVDCAVGGNGDGTGSVQLGGGRRTSVAAEARRRRCRRCVVAVPLAAILSTVWPSHSVR